MKRKLLILLAATLLSCSLMGCASEEPVVVNVENKEDISGTIFCKDALVYIGNYLYYDSTTRIVYLKFESVGGFSYMTAYYASNGLPYKYNPETNTFEEIEVE